MDNEQCRVLIRKYEIHRVLWDAKLKNYHNKEYREDAWKAISNEMQIPVCELKRKMTALMGSYRREKSRRKRRLRSGSKNLIFLVSRVIADLCAKTEQIHCLKLWNYTCWCFTYFYTLPLDWCKNQTTFKIWTYPVVALRFSLNTLDSRRIFGRKWLAVDLKISNYVFRYTGQGGVYTSKWFAFDCFSFLSGKDAPSETTDTTAGVRTPYFSFC